MTITVTPPAPPLPDQAAPRRRLRRRRGRRPPFPKISATILVVLLLLAVVGPYLAPVDPVQNDLSRQLEPPVLFGGSWDRPLGTDFFGRDILSRIMAGARVTAFVAFVSVLASAAIGTVLGMLAGYSRRPSADAVISRLADLTLAFPVILLGLLFAVQRGPSFSNVIIVLTILLWARFAKLARAEVLSWRNRDFIALSVVSGGRTAWILRRHLLPNISNTLIVLATFQLGWAVLAEASLSFLGAGVPPPEPAWGSMVAEGRELMREAWWVSTVPGMAIVLVVLSLNLFGDWLRDRFDPRLRQL